MSDDDGFRIFQQAITAYDAPAFIRRARDVEYAWAVLVDTCRQKRDKLLELPRMRLAMLFKRLPSPMELPSRLCHPDEAAYLRNLYHEWQPKLRVDVELVRSDRQIERLLTELRESFTRSNQRFEQYLNAINLDEVNRLRENYNKYYVLEKECAVLSSEVAQSAFVPMSPATTDQLIELFPLLKVPKTVSN